MFLRGLVFATGIDQPDDQSPLPYAGSETHLSLDPNESPSSVLPSQQSLQGPEVFFETWKDRPEVQKYLNYFTSGYGRNWILDGMKDAEPFKDFILDSISSRSMPRELYFLVLVESTFDVDAVSRSGAAGLWQFMLNSLGKMKTSEWIDERFDFWSSTSAALEKLSYNYSALQDWLLALAAYNAGLGRIQRLIQKYKGQDFWDLSAHSDFPAETREYVPRILAAAYIGSHAARYGFPAIWTEKLSWEKLAVSGSVQVRQLEEKSGVPFNLLVKGNAELRFEATPADGKTHYIKIPLVFHDAVVTALAGQALISGSVKYTVVSGDTLFGIAKKYGTSETAITNSNPGLDAKNLTIGQGVIIPLPNRNQSSETNN